MREKFLAREKFLVREREKITFCRRGTNGMKIVRFLIEENESHLIAKDELSFLLFPSLPSLWERNYSSLIDKRYDCIQEREREKELFS